MSSSSTSKSKSQTSGADSPIEVKQSGTQGGNGSITVDQKEYDAIVAERDQLKINLYLLGNNLKEIGFNVSDSGNGIQRVGTDIIQRIKLTPEQIRMMQETLKQPQQPSQQ